MGKSNVGRPKKDSRRFNFNLDSALYDDLIRICQITGRNKTDEIECMMRNYIQSFKSESGTIECRTAYYRIATACNEEPIYHECVVLDDNPESDKVKIYWGGLMKVDRSSIVYEEPKRYVSKNK